MITGRAPVGTSSLRRTPPHPGKGTPGIDSQQQIHKRTPVTDGRESHAASQCMKIDRF